MRADTIRKDARLRCQRLVLQYGNIEKLAIRLKRHGITRTWLIKLVNEQNVNPHIQQLDRLVDALDKVERA